MDSAKIPHALAEFRICCAEFRMCDADIRGTGTAKLICVFVFAYAKSWFSHNEALLLFSFHYIQIATELQHEKTCLWGF